MSWEVRYGAVFDEWYIYNPETKEWARGKSRRLRVFRSREAALKALERMRK